MAEFLKNVTPTKEQIKLMNEFADLLEPPIKRILDGELNFESQNAYGKLMEAMHWYHAYLAKSNKTEKDTEVLERKKSVIVN